MVFMFRLCSVPMATECRRGLSPVTSVKGGPDLLKQANSYQGCGGWVQIEVILSGV